MKIPLIETSNFRYIRIDSRTNRVHLLVPFVAGLDISTDNTCKSDLELKAFFANGAAVKELESYKSTLEFHLSLLEEGPLRQAKEARLAQINEYLKAVITMTDDYKNVVNDFLKKPSNLYSMQLRPSVQDPMSRVVNPVFTINRSNDNQGNPKSALFNAMHEAYPTVAIALLDPKSQLEAAVLQTLRGLVAPTFAQIQAEMTSQYQRLFGEALDFSQMTNPIRGVGSGFIAVTQAYIDRTMGFSTASPAATQDYIDALWGACAPNVNAGLAIPPFYSVSNHQHNKAETLSLMTQFFLAHVNIHCKVKGISQENFGVILDTSPDLSRELVAIIVGALTSGVPVEKNIIAFFNNHSQKFGMMQSLTETDQQAIQEKFETTYRTVTATKENPHMDDFMLLDTEARGENAHFVTHQGLICTNFANIVPEGLNPSYFNDVRKDAATHPEIIPPQDEATMTVDIEPEVLVDKLGDLQWERLPKEVVDACRALPSFKVRQLLDDVAKGKQEEANTVLKSSDDIQALLRTPGKFTDYSGRTFKCTAYEYAYWAKDTHMCRMLESHMDDETKAFMLEKVNEMEHSGLAYQQHGQSYKNPHYDMSFVLKNLSLDEFLQLQTIVGQDAKIQGATKDNYQQIAFTATEYEALKKALEQHRPNSFGEKLKFDFHSLITALDTYMTNYCTWDYHQQVEAWMKVGIAQRDVPAHVAHEYCRPNRSFYPLPAFNEKKLPRVLTFDNFAATDKSWFPLSSSSGLGFDFAVGRMGCDRAFATDLLPFSHPADLASVSHLDKVRIVDLTQSRENLSRPVSQLGLGR